jgi:hypothetical protein
LDPETLSSGGGPEPPPDPNLVLVLNLLLFGFAGYWILGQKHKAVIAAIGWVLGLFTCGVVSGLVAAAAAIDGYQQANRLQADASKGL